MEKEKGRYEIISDPEMDLRVTDTFAGVLAQAVASVSKEANLEKAHIILAIAETESNGREILKSIAGSHRFTQLIDELRKKAAAYDYHGPPSGKIATAEGTEEYSGSVEALLKSAAKFSGGLPVGTEHIVLAESENNFGPLKRSLEEIGITAPIKDRIKELSRLLASAEPSAETGEVIFFPYEKPISPSPHHRERLNFHSDTHFVDLIDQAREEVLADVVTRERWTSDLLNSVESQKISVIVTDLMDEADAVVFGLANQLALDEEGFFDIQKMAMIEPASLVSDPVTAINNAVSYTKDGVLYLPDLQNYLELSPEYLRLHAAIANDKIRVITTMTENQWSKVKEELPFARVKPIFPESPSVEKTIKIIGAKKEKIEMSLSTKGVRIKITDEAIETAAKLADQYYRQTLPPSGARALIIFAGNAIRMRMSGMVDLHDERFEADGQVDSADVYLALERLTGIEVTPESPELYLEMEKKLREKVVGQDEALKSVSDAIRRAKAGLKDRKKPIGSFMFMGPSGVGKTELAKTLAWFLFDDENAMIRLDMSEYQEKHTISRLIGAPPGYVGYHEGGQLTEAIRKKPYSVIVFDEVEKAHPEVRNALLQIMDEGRLTDGQGRTVDFRNSVIIMTGNVGSEYFRFEKEDGLEKVVAAVEEKIKDSFRPEFLNRLTDIVIFNSLKEEHLLQIVDIQMRKVNETLAEQNLSIELDKQAKVLLASEGYHPEYGARPLQRVIEKRIEDQLSEMILAKKFEPGDKIKATVKEGKIVLTKKKTKTKGE